MSLTTVFWAVSLFWIIIHVLHYIDYQRRNGLSNTNILPLARSDISQRHVSNFKIELQTVILKIKLTSLNSAHGTLARYLQLPTLFERKLQRSLKLFYNLGIIAASIGAIIAFFSLIITVERLFASIAGYPRLFKTSNHHGSSKRDLYEGVDITSSSNQEFLPDLLIPGYTVPLYHLSYLLTSLFVSQVVHEAGHALAAASENIPLQSFGLSLTFIIPSALTELSPTLNDLHALAKLRIIAAGSWHNLVFYGLLKFLASLFFYVNIWTVLGWSDVSDRGLVVLSVASDSPLIYYLQPGSVVIALDDVFLSATGEPEVSWSNYLLSNSDSTSGYEKGGWCAAADWFSEQPQSCCPPISQTPQPPSVALSCFVPFPFDSLSLSGDIPEGHCIDPIPFLSSNELEPNGNAQRCLTSASCRTITKAGSTGENMSCIQPHESAELLRLTFEPAPWQIDISGYQAENKTQTILWSGPRKEIWDQVVVGKYQSRHILLPLWLPSSVSLFFSYLLTMTISLYFLNLLFLPFLDGGHLLSTVLLYFSEYRSRDIVPPHSIDLEAMGSGLRSRASSPVSRNRNYNRRIFTLVEAGFTRATIALSCLTAFELIWTRLIQ